MSEVQFSQTVQAEEEWLDENGTPLPTQEEINERLREFMQMRAEDEDCLPVHKRMGYAERMNELADMRRKEIRENGL